MELSLTKPEMEAVLQLMNLRTNSSDDFRVFWVDYLGENHEEETGFDEALPRRKTRFRSIADIYKRTRPLIENRAPKRARI
ncbi:hypothetical protein F511_05367 [Dorcoceras hygrometricum]|uniref:Uncharacterized protein n=1 Tax=Dorcoceras hygrometricum TaxID=472368 RepID=A0A2Z7ALR3_9LAMI|nr:hypothetical protein F511_05367 [Dorcoceras hygrometricum]